MVGWWLEDHVLFIGLRFSLIKIFEKGSVESDRYFLKILEARLLRLVRLASVWLYLFGVFFLLPFECALDVDFDFY